MVSKLELGGPLLADLESTIMSLLTSRSSTPPTPLTGLTIPSPGPHDDREKYGIPISRSPKVEKQDIKVEENKVESRDENIRPAEIPLPPSPKVIKESLPFRRPRVSNPLTRVVSNTSTPRSLSGRRVSSALQYALHPDQTPGNTVTERVGSGASDSASVDLAYYEEMRKEAMSSSDIDDEDKLEEINDSVWDSSLGFGGQVPDLVGGKDGIMPDEDEAWMGYVRAQLNTLFPDYFDPNEETQEEGEGGGDVSVSTISSNDLISPPGRLPRGIPNVRSEIGGLSEEIARLRGVVSGLAEGMRAQNGPGAVGSSDVEAKPLPVETKDDADGDEVPKEFLKVSPVESGNVF
jgi:hypothetical protein